MFKRVQSLIERTVDELILDLSGLTVLTEAASGWYAVTPVIAKMAGAERVFAVGKDSRYGTLDSIGAQINALAKTCGVAGIEVVKRSQKVFAQADIVTNLGFVRPIDAEAVSWMRPTAVVPLMVEAWEVRPEDIDVMACKRRAIPVLATNEDFWLFLDYCAWLAVKLLLDAGIEMHRARVGIVGSDRIADALRKLFKSLGIFNPVSPDAIVVSNWDGVMSFDLPPETTVIHLAKKGRMDKTLAYLGLRPVVELHCLGLKIGEELAHAVERGLVGRQAEEDVLIRCNFAQRVF